VCGCTRVSPVTIDKVNHMARVSPAAIGRVDRMIRVSPDGQDHDRSKSCIDMHGLD